MESAGYPGCNCVFGVYGTALIYRDEGVLLLGHGKTSVAALLAVEDGEVVADDVVILYLRKLGIQEDILFAQRVGDVQVFRSLIRREVREELEKKGVAKEDLESSREAVRINKVVFLTEDGDEYTPLGRCAPRDLYYLVDLFLNTDFASETEACARKVVNLLECGRVEIYTVPRCSTVFEKADLAGKVLQGSVGPRHGHRHGGGLLFRERDTEGTWEYEPFSHASWRLRVVMPLAARENLHITIRSGSEEYEYRLKMFTEGGQVYVSGRRLDDVIIARGRSTWREVLLWHLLEKAAAWSEPPVSRPPPERVEVCPSDEVPQPGFGLVPRILGAVRVARSKMTRRKRRGI